MTPTVTRRRLIGNGTGLALTAPVIAPLAGFVAGCGDEDASTEASSTAPNASQAPPRDGEEALDRLLAGNQRFVESGELNEGRDTVTRAELVEEQKPFAERRPG